MMRFSRASLIAVCTAAAVTASSLTVPAMAEAPAAAVIQVAEETTTEENSSGSSDMNMDEISEYILIITGVIGALSAALTLATALDRAAK